MSRLTRHVVSVTTDSDGAATGYTDVPVNGFIHSIRYIPDGSSPLDTNADVDITGEATGIVVLDDDNIGTSAYTVMPRFATTDQTNTASLYASGGEPVEDRVGIANERLKVVIASGGDTLTGVFHILVEGA